MTFGWPSSAIPLAALVLGAAALALARYAAPIRIGRPRLWALAIAAASAVLSAVWIGAYLRGGPRIIDATAYFLEARALAEGHLAWPAGDPPASVMGRFLVRDALGSGDHVAVIFPPGYPAVLASGFWVGAPMAVGPILAALVAWLTFDLARSATGDASGVVPVAAAALVLVSGAMRYHTADTMSHGLAAALTTAALAAAMRLRARPATTAAGLAAGASLGLLAATRPVSAVAALAATVLVAGRGARVRHAAAALVAAIPGLLLLLAHQRAATGAWLASSQALYYETSDGPLGCFRYGFGDGVGCVHEHGDFVRANLASGYGALEAAATSLRRLKMHGVDALNAEPLAVAVGLPALWLAARDRRLSGLAATLPLFVLAYAPFYFDGSYPGGGARFFADALPAEIVVVAAAATALGRAVARRWSRAAWLGEPARAATALVGLSLLGFAFRAHVDHAALRDREGGSPMFLATELERAAGPAGDRGRLVFVDTDHALLLGLDPEARAGSGGTEVARLRRDDNDFFLWNERGRPPAFVYSYDLGSGAHGIDPYEPREVGHLTGASFWPPLRQEGGYALPAAPVPGCAPDARALRLHAGPDGTAEARLALPRGALARRIAAVFTVKDAIRARLEVLEGGRSVAVLRSDDFARAPAAGPDGTSCVVSKEAQVPRSGDVDLRLSMETEAGSAAGGASIHLVAVLLTAGEMR